LEEEFGCALGTDKIIVGATPDWPAEKLEELTAKACPLGRCAVPEDIARVVAFLASDDGGWVNGASDQCMRKAAILLMSYNR
jgi:NAD(P)-dependent dehydrogenase (short-subunit alcohol dehydrogenase family)